MSGDDTPALIEAWRAAHPGFPVHLQEDDEVAYFQSRKMTEFARRLVDHDRYTWILPCDADEHWTHGSGRPIRDVLPGLAPDIAYVNGDLYHYIPSAMDDPDIANPFFRIRWRMKQPAGLPKVCVRYRNNMTIEAGNHAASFHGEQFVASTGGLVVRHYSWRSRDQYVRKIVNGAKAYAETGLPDEVGGHWRMFGVDPDPATVADHFTKWFWRDDPGMDPDLFYDPAPLP